jgi:PHD/YefM family antitoxin component YafN of YafNO toxin-antitoxin module
MDPCTAAVICKMEEDLDLLSLTDFSFDLISELLEEIKTPNNMEHIAELHKDIFEIRGSIERTYEKKYDKKLVWKSKSSL